MTKNNVINKTHEVRFEEHGCEHKLRINYGLHRMGTQTPYFSITAEEFIKHPYGKQGRYRWEWCSCGCLHDEIRKRAPELGDLLKWHLFYLDSGPIHYEENGMFWLERSLLDAPSPAYSGDMTAWGDEALENFKKVTLSEVFKDSLDEVLRNRRSIDREELLGFVRALLKDQLPDLFMEFQKDMNRYGIDLPGR